MRSSKKSSKQLTIEEVNDRTQQWGIHDSHSEHVHRKLGKMIAVDCQPYSIVEDIGFNRLVRILEPRYHLPSRKFLTGNIILRIKVGVEGEVRKCVDGVQHFSFTTDVWTANVSNESLLSLTAHWVTKEFEWQLCVLSAVALEGSHTRAYMCAKLKESLTSWKIGDAQVHVFVHDNGANIVKAIDDLGFTSLGCLAHTLQLVVHDGVLSQHAVLDVHVLAVCR